MYKSYDNDPYGVRIYTLENGLKVYLSKSSLEPRIKTRIAVRAGATADPPDATGLAHYVEHMMFKGTDLIGALNREKEASIISKIKHKYEELLGEESPEEIHRINSEIDKLSSAASLEAIPGELDKLYSIMGCRGVNARTGFEETVYENDIPAVELRRWVTLEKERFTSPVLRLFPPELEVVYEEFNQSQDDDVSRSYDKLLSNLFPKHPYGRSGILGKGEHLKKPSMEKIESFLNTWYVPANMALILTGDLDFDETISIISEVWGNIPGGKQPSRNAVIEEKLNRATTSTVYGSDSPFVLLGYRFEGFGSDDELFLILIDMIMSNNQAGTLDLNLVQTQKVLEAASSYEVYKDYSWFSLYGVPGSRQSLKGVVRELKKEIEKLKSGEFEEWYNRAVITCFEIDRLNELDGSGKIESFVDAFITGLSWDNYLKRVDRLKSITFNELVDFVNRRFKENYTVIYKKKGQAKDLLFIKKPNLTPVVLNREVESVFCSEFKSLDVVRNRPEFANFGHLSPIDLGRSRTLYYEKNSTNELFEILLISKRGRYHDLLIHYGTDFRDFTGAGNLSSREFQQELFKVGLDLVISCRDDRTTISLSGKREDMELGLNLLHKFITSGSADNRSFIKYIDRVRLTRKNSKSSKRVILWGGLYNHLLYGEINPFRFYMPIHGLKRVGKKRLLEAVKDTFTSDFDVYYYGPEGREEIYHRSRELSEKITLSSKEVSLKRFTLQEQSSSRFLYTHYEMVQAEILVTGIGTLFDKSLLPVVFLFNEYFGGGMDSVVFQEVRERRGLAYSAYASYSLPRNIDENFIFTFYVGTQGDKVSDVLRCILGLLEFFPRVESYFDAVKSSILKNIESESVLDKDLYFVKRESDKYGLDSELREIVYKGVKELSIDDLEEFFNRYIKSLQLHTLLLGDKKELDIEGINNILGIKGEYLSLKRLFGY